MTLRVYDVRGQSTSYKLPPDSRVLYWDSPLSSGLVGPLFTRLFPLLDPFLPSRLASEKWPSPSLTPPLLVLSMRVHGGDIAVCINSSLIINCILRRHRLGVLRLNFYLFIPLLTGCINGYNSSIVNG